MTKNTGFPHSFFDDIDFFDFLPSRDRDDRDDDGHGHHDHEGNEHISPLPYDAAAFPDGVSSGDVTQTSAVLWARAGHTGRVTFQVATDAAFHHIVDVVTVNVNDPLPPSFFGSSGGVYEHGTTVGCRSVIGSSAGRLEEGSFP